MEDFECKPIDPLSTFASGVQVFGVNEGGRLSESLRKAMLMRVYQIDACFGRATHDATATGRVLIKTPWRNVKQYRLEKLISALQSEHQKSMFMYAGVPNLQSPEAYHLACKGLIRPPHTDTPPIIYGIRLSSFQPPLFSVEIHVINENKQYLANLIDNIGARMKSSACCLKIRRTQYGPFTLKDALLDKYWNLPMISQNIITSSEKGKLAMKNVSRDTIERKQEKLKSSN